MPLALRTIFSLSWILSFLETLSRHNKILSSSTNLKSSFIVKLCWNDALWLVKTSDMTLLRRPIKTHYLSVAGSQAMLKFVLWHWVPLNFTILNPSTPYVIDSIKFYWRNVCLFDSNSLCRYFDVLFYSISETQTRNPFVWR